MNFTNTDSVREDIYWGLDGPLWDQNHEVWEWVLEVDWKVQGRAYVQINPIKYKITQEIFK